MLGSSSSRIIGACLYKDASNNYKIFIANDENGLSGYDFGNHTLYGPQESGAGWLQYDTGKIVSIDCAPVQYGNYLVLACNTGKVASFDGANWKYPDGTGSGSGPYNSGSAVGDKRITALLAFGSILVVGAEEGRIASWNGSSWTTHDAASGLRSNGDMMGRRAVSVMAALGTTRVVVYEDSGRAFCWDSSTSQWTAINLSLEAGDSEVRLLQCGPWSDRLFFGTENGKIAYWDGTDCHSSSTTAISTARASASALFEEDVLVAGTNGKIASLDVTKWKNADGTGPGTGVYNDGAAVNGDEIVSIVAKGDKIILIAREKTLATGDVLVGTWYKYDGTTSSLSYSGRCIPHQLIGFFASPPGAEWRVCNGSAATPDLNGCFPKGHTSQGAPAGSNSHDHGAYSGNTGTSSAPGATAACSHPPGEICDRYHLANHSHSMAHTHSAVSHLPLYYDLVPAARYDATMIPTSFVGLFETLPAGWTQYSAANGKYLRCSTAAAGGYGGAATHAHAYSGNSGTAGSAADSIYGSATAPKTHYHSISHTHAAYSNTPPYSQLIPATPNATLAELPSGIICFFLGNTVPSGWSVYSVAQGKFVKMASTSEPAGGGTSTHTHSTDTFSATGSATYSSSGYATATSSGSGASALAHTHSHSHGHSTAGTLEPQNCQLLMCKKD